MPKIQLIRVAYAESWTAGKLYVIYEIIYCEWLKFTSEILIYVNLYLSQQQILSHLFVNKGSPVSAVLCTPYRPILYIYIIFKYLGHKMSSSSYEFGPL